MSRKALPAALLFVAVFIAAVNLRAGITSLGAVLADVLLAFHAGGTIAGIITAIPGLLFALFGLVAVPVATRLGLTRTLCLGMALTLLGLALRPWIGTISLFILLTACVGVGIALGNVLLPAWIKNHGGRHIVALMTIYGSVLGLSGALGPLTALWGFDFRWALVLWVIPAAVQLLVWLVFLPKVGRDVPRSGAVDLSEAGRAKPISLWRAPTAVYLMFFFGLQSMNAYIQMGWLPKILVDSGASTNAASVALAITAGCGILGGLVMPVVIDRWRNIQWLPILFAVLMALGYLGLWWDATAAPLVWSVLLGVGGFSFPMAIALIPARSRVPMVTARLSGFVQPVGYLIAAVGPFAVGMAREALGGWDLILPVLAALCALMGAAGFRAARRGFIDDELAAQG
ncbi:putative transporter YycB [Corynebacterium atrinae]|uniref:MFS transporter n=1 Tax=Corynebacterium atrinae TaxID=1336740 RepID=UPI0025B5454D|nr:MFS transporter [Corynebacterium atrinae]WJY62838.1 putative transporter YycB [Corynebacterium atrinae]